MHNSLRKRMRKERTRVGARGVGATWGASDEDCALMGCAARTGYWALDVLDVLGR